jgi:hypothetical protein
MTTKVFTLDEMIATAKEINAKLKANEKRIKKASTVCKGLSLSDIECFIATFVDEKNGYDNTDKNCIEYFNNLTTYLKAQTDRQKAKDEKANEKTKKQEISANIKQIMNEQKTLYGCLKTIIAYKEIASKDIDIELLISEWNDKNKEIGKLLFDELSKIGKEWIEKHNNRLATANGFTTISTTKRYRLRWNGVLNAYEVKSTYSISEVYKVCAKLYPFNINAHLDATV